MASTGVLGSILVDFSTKGTFPEEESVSAAPVEESALPGALAALNTAKIELEVSSLESPSCCETLLCIFNSFS